MKALLDIRGWTKYIEVSQEAIRKRRIIIPLTPPMSYLVAPTGEGDILMRQAELMYHGYTHDGIPVFKY